MHLSLIPLEHAAREELSLTNQNNIQQTTHTYLTPKQYKEIAFSQLKPINLWIRVFKIDKIRFLVLLEICIRSLDTAYCQCGELTRVMNFNGMHVMTPKECAPKRQEDKKM